ncbi:hypothetical protein R1flu_028888 [Riccia fluitans]|uniref:Uncharacterized protein n=1 Tax=Riccia fluitans TaxID=41844 RepID=A0ABD1XNI7_9MARC
MGWPPELTPGPPTSSRPESPVAPTGVALSGRTPYQGLAESFHQDKQKGWHGGITQIGGFDQGKPLLQVMEFLLGRFNLSRLDFLRALPESLLELSHLSVLRQEFFP